MAAADQLIALVTKTADKLNALNTAIGTKANIGVSSDAGNNLSVGSDSKPYFNASNIPLGVSGDTDNALELGTDSKPYLDSGLFVPSTRILSAGTGINVIGDLSQNRSITLDFDYLDGRYGEGFKQREAVVAATSSNITLSGLQTIDGVSLAAGDRVLVRKQTNAAQNGVYIAASTAWTRATDFDEPDIEEVTQGASVYVEDGTLLKGTGWTLQTPPPYVIGTTELDFIQYAGAGSYTGGNLITIDGNQINHDSGSWVAKSNLSGAQVISNLSVDAYGHPTNWTVRNLTAGNIGAEPSFSKNTAFNKNFGTSAGTVAQGNDSRINNGQTAYSWGNHASAGYITGSYTGFDSRYVNVGGDEVTGNIKFGDNIRALFGDGDDMRIFHGANTNWIQLFSGDFIIRDAFAAANRFTFQRSSGHFIASGRGIFGDYITVSGAGNNIRSTGSGTGAGNVNYISLNESDGVTTQGLLGFISSTNSDLYVNNSISGSSLRLKGNSDLSYNGNMVLESISPRITFSETDESTEWTNIAYFGRYEIQENGATRLRLSQGGGGNGLLYNDGVSDRIVYHSGNFTPSDYVPNTRTITAGSGLTGGGNLTANRTLSVDFGTTAGTVAQGNHTHPASDITSGTLANARISQSSVTQHNTAINAGQVDGKHIWTGSQASYDAIGTKDSNTIYFIT